MRHLDRVRFGVGQGLRQQRQLPNLIRLHAPIDPMLAIPRMVTVSAARIE